MSLNDSWLRRHRDALFPRAPGTSLDVGAGRGRDSAALAELGFSVIALDREPGLMSAAVRTLPSVTLQLQDLTHPLPLPGDSFDVIVASLSLHYFRWEVTRRVIAELRRVIHGDGVLLFRLNAFDDLGYGAGAGEEVEPGLYRVAGRKGWFSDEKRFFTAEMVHTLFADSFAVGRIEHRTEVEYVTAVAFGLPSKSSMNASPKRLWEGEASPLPPATVR